LAIAYGNDEIAEVLVHCGADITARHVTPPSLARGWKVGQLLLLSKPIGGLLNMVPIVVTH
jgi:hypothetical protein